MMEATKTLSTRMLRNRDVVADRARFLAREVVVESMHTATLDFTGYTLLNPSRDSF